MMNLSHRLAGAALLALVAACSTMPPPLPTPEPAPAPDPSEVEHVLFLVGDPGEARRETSPILPRLEQDIERWTKRLQADSAVTVLYLGDIVYPDGMHPPGSEEFAHDSAVVMDQVRLVAGPFAREHHAQGYFLAGNHDWGLEEDWEGAVRLNHLDEFLELARAYTGAQVRLVPEAGTGGPYVVDVGEHVRLVLLDTAWWILDGGEHSPLPERRLVLEEIEHAMETADGRHVLFAAHHPFKSAGPHGGEFDFWETLGARYLLARSGAILQDVTSIPYRELEQGLRAIFARTGPPAAFIGGHEHSLQVIGATRPTDPRHSIVSGSASKVSNLGPEHGMHFGRAAVGYMRLLIEKDGDMTLFVEAAPEEFLECPEDEPQRRQCMAEGIAAFETVYSQRLVPEGDAATP